MQPSGSKPGPLANKFAVSSAAKDDGEDDDEESETYDSNEQLSKSERRRLKKMARRERSGERRLGPIWALLRPPNALTTRLQRLPQDEAAFLRNP
jgi:hypothetical protein